MNARVPLSRIAIAAAVLAVVAMVACRHDDAHPPLLENPGPAPEVGGSSSGGATADGGGSADGGAVVTLVETGTPVTSIAADANALYFAVGAAGATDAGAFPSGTIQGVPRTGGGATAIVTGAVAPTRLLVAGSELLFIDDDPRGARVVGVRLDTAQVIELATKLTSPSAIASDGVYVYIASSAAGTGVEIDRVPLAGGQQPSPVASVAGALVPRGIALSGATVVFVGADATGGSIFVAPAAGGAADTIATLPTGTLSDLAIAGADAFVVEGGASGSIMRVPVARGTAVPLATAEPDPAAIAAFGTNVYWLRRTTGELVRAPSAGGAPTVIASGLEGAHALAIGAAAAYVATSHAIVRTPK